MTTMTLVATATLLVTLMWLMGMWAWLLILWLWTLVVLALQCCEGNDAIVGVQQRQRRQRQQRRASSASAETASSSLTSATSIQIFPDPLSSSSPSPFPADVVLDILDSSDSSDDYDINDFNDEVEEAEEEGVGNVDNEDAVNGSVYEEDSAMLIPQHQQPSEQQLTGISSEYFGRVNSFDCVQFGSQL